MDKKIYYELLLRNKKDTSRLVCFTLESVKETQEKWLNRGYAVEVIKVTREQVTLSFTNDNIN
jgi:hypothetical protein